MEKRAEPQITLAMLDERTGLRDDQSENTREALVKAFERRSSMTPLQLYDLPVPRALRLQILLHRSVFSRVERSELACEFAARVLPACDNGWLREALMVARKWREARSQLTELARAPRRGERSDDALAMCEFDERCARRYLRTCQTKVLVVGLQLGITTAEQRVIRAVAAAIRVGSGPIAPGQDAAWVAANHAASAVGALNPKAGAFAEEMGAQLELTRQALVRIYGQQE